MKLKELLMAYELKMSSCGDVKAEIKVDSYLTTVCNFENYLQPKEADIYAVNFAKWLIDRDNLKEILYEQTWEQILNQYHK